MNKRVAGVLAGVLVTAAMAGCDSHEVVKKETKLYNMQSYSEGNLRAQSQGKGLNGKFLKEMQIQFGHEGVPLTHEMYAEDGRGNISYMYMIAGNPLQYITLHVFSNEAERIERIHNWYGDQKLIDTPRSRTVIYNYSTASLIYTSSGKEKGKYDPEVKKVFNSLIDRMK